MLEGLFPEDVATAWGDPADPAKPLFPDEAALVARAVPKRQREFAKGRECARTALESLGHLGIVLVSGESREPLWPAAVVGSITHTAGFCAAAVGKADRYAGIGIDAEPAEPLAREVAKRVCSAEDERSWHLVTSLDAALVPRLVFTVKEAIYKCQFPVSRKFLGFGDVEVAILDDGTFEARLLVQALPFQPGDVFSGRWKKTGAYLLSGAWLPRTA